MLFPILDIETMWLKETEKLDESNDLINQLDKCLEEFNEVVKEALDFNDNKISNKRVLEECNDLIQATINLMALIATVDELMLSVSNHQRKMVDRDYPVKANLMVKLVR